MSGACPPRKRRAGAQMLFREHAMETQKIIVIVPAYDEAASIAGVIEDIRGNFPAADILIVDDGSSDGTGKIALQHGAEVLTLPFNLGIGSAVQTGYQYARREGYDIAVQLDGDGQHDASFLPEMVSPLANGECDLVLGSRYLAGSGYKGALGRRAGTAFFSWTLSLLLSQKVTDSTSGFRAVNRKAIELFAADYPRDYPEVEALLLAHVTRLKIKEIPVTMRDRAGGKSSINLFRAAYYMVKVFLALIVGFSRRRAPRAE